MSFLKFLDKRIFVLDKRMNKERNISSLSEQNSVNSLFCKIQQILIDSIQG